MGTVAVPLTQGKVAVVDESDYSLVSGFRWRAQRNADGRLWYAVRWGRSGQGRKHVLMHRVILAAPEGVQVDHRDGDGLNNRRENLRLATRAQNAVNASARRATRTGYKGAYWHRASRCFTAQIRVGGRTLSLGYFATAEEAARAYDAKARELHGEFARTNF